MSGQRHLLTKVLLWLAIILMFGLSSCSQTIEEKYLTGDWNVYYYDYTLDVFENLGGHLSLKDSQYEFIPNENITPSRLDILSDYLLFVQYPQGSATCKSVLESEKAEISELVATCTFASDSQTQLLNVIAIDGEEGETYLQLTYPVEPSWFPTWTVRKPIRS